MSYSISGQETAGPSSFTTPPLEKEAKAAPLAVAVAPEATKSLTLAGHETSSRIEPPSKTLNSQSVTDAGSSERGNFPQNICINMNEQKFDEEPEEGSDEESDEGSDEGHEATSPSTKLYKKIYFRTAELLCCNHRPLLKAFPVLIAAGSVIGVGIGFIIANAQQAPITEVLDPILLSTFCGLSGIVGIVVIGSLVRYSCKKILLSRREHREELQQQQVSNSIDTNSDHEHIHVTETANTCNPLNIIGRLRTYCQRTPESETNTNSDETVNSNPLNVRSGLPRLNVLSRLRTIFQRTPAPETPLGQEEALPMQELAHNTNTNLATSTKEEATTRIGDIKRQMEALQTELLKETEMAGKQDLTLNQ